MRDEIQKGAARLYCSSQSMCDSVKPPTDCDQTTHSDHEKSEGHNAKHGVVEAQDLPGSRNHRRVEAGNSDNEHPVLFCHRSAKLVRRACNFSRGANISSEDCQNRCRVTECDVSAPGISCADEHRRVGYAIGNFVVKLSCF